METNSHPSSSDITDTIVAIATPLGEGGLGVIRLSGPRSFPIAAKIFHANSSDLINAPSHTLHHGWITNEGRAVDDVVVSLFRAPRSYTGEDVVEFSCHGSPAVLREVVQLCQREGARLAKPGEFTERAYLNGKLDLAQAEAVADLIHARSSAARQAATDQLRGNLSARIKKIRGATVDLLARLEANMDFVEEDIPALPRETMEAVLKNIKFEIDQLLSTSVKARILREGLRVALLGKPNVGKSSLFNALLAEDRAIVTPHPGTTRDTLEEEVQWEGMAVVLIDTAGLRKTDDPIEREGTLRAERLQQTSDLVVFVVDASSPFDSNDENIFAEIRGRNKVVAVNKVDLNHRIDLAALQKMAADCPIVMVSAKNAGGLMDLKQSIVRAIRQDIPEVEGVPQLVNQRHVEELEKASRKINSAMAALHENKSDESIAFDLREALHALGSITGDDITEDVLSAIFRQFCIGK